MSEILLKANHLSKNYGKVKAVSDIRKKFKNEIHLDTNIHIKLDFINPESAEKFVEKGWDEERQMYYYLLYFNRETKN